MSTQMPSPSYDCSLKMVRLIKAVAEHPDLDFRLWAGMTILINLDVGDPAADAEDVAIDVVSSCLISGAYLDHLDDEFDLMMQPDGTVTDVDYDAVYGEDIRAAALLALMKSPDLQARQLALRELAMSTANEADVEVTAVALLRVADWISAENSNTD